MKKIVSMLTLVIIVLFLSGCSYKIIKEDQTNNQQQYSAIQPTQPPSIDLKSKCATDGKTFIQNYEQTNNYTVGKYRPVWGEPQYHFDTKLNTCLVYIWYVLGTGEYSAGNITDSDYTSTIYSIVYNFVFDIYSNQAVLQSVNNRTTPWKGQNKDTLASYPSYQNVPNLEENAFFSQLKVLMNE